MKNPILIRQKIQNLYLNHCLMKIQEELQHPIDRMSKRLIANNIELLLNYCLRFYERQFITRQDANRDILTRFEALLDNYFTGDNAMQKGLPTVKYCAGELCLSSNYFGDLIKKETGKTALEYIQNKIIGNAKEKLLIPSNSISQIAMKFLVIGNLVRSCNLVKCFKCGLNGPI